MSNGTKLFLALIAAYLITHVGYWLLKFNPLRDLQFLPGLLIDFTIWAFVFFLAHWAISKTTAPKPNPQ